MKLGNPLTPEQILRNNWLNISVSGVTWLSKPKHKEAALTHMTYGNEAGLNTRYSSVAIFAVIPPWIERNPVA